METPISAYRIVVPIIALFFIVITILQFRKREKSPLEFIFWMGLWIVIAIIAILPTSTQFLSRMLGFESNVNALVFTGLGVNFFLIYRLMISMHGIQRSLTELSRKIALKDEQNDSEE